MNNGYIYAIINGVAISVLPVVVKSESHINVLLFAALTTLVAACTTTRGIPLKPTPLLMVIAIGGAVVGPLLYYKAIQMTTASNGAVLGNMEVVFTVFLALLVFKQHIAYLKLIGMVVMMSGIILTSVLINGFVISPSLMIGDILLVICTIVFGLDNNFADLATKRFSVLKIMEFRWLIGGAILISFVFILNIPIILTFQDIFLIIVTGVLAYGVPIYLLFKAIAKIGAPTTLIITSSTFNIVVLVLTSFILHEHVPWTTSIGVVAIGIGIYIISEKPVFTRFRKALNF